MLSCSLVRTWDYYEADRSGVRVSLASVSHNCTTFITKGETKLYEKPEEEQMSEKCFTWVDWIDILKFLESADVLRRLWKKGRVSYSSLFPSSEVNFSFFSEKQEYLTDLQSIHSDVRVCWLGCEWFRLKWLCPNHVAFSASSSISWDTGAWVRFHRGELFW